MSPYGFDPFMESNSKSATLTSQIANPCSFANLGHFRPTLYNQLNKNENNRLIDTQKPFSRNPLSNFIREVIILGSMMVLRGVIGEELIIFAKNSAFLGF